MWTWKRLIFRSFRLLQGGSECADVIGCFFWSSVLKRSILRVFLRGWWYSRAHVLFPDLLRPSADPHQIVPNCETQAVSPVTIFVGL